MKRTVSSILAHELEKRRSSDARYSCRTLAKDLEMSASQLSMILSGKRNLSFRSATKVAHLLKFNRVQAAELTTLTKKSSRVRPERFSALKEIEAIRHLQLGLTLDQPAFELISDWYHLSILQIMQLKSYRSLDLKADEILFLSRALGLGEATVAMALLQLKSAGAIETTLSGKGYQPTSSFVLVSASHPQASTKRFHQEVIQKAANALQNDHGKQDAFKTTLLSVESSDVESIREEISKFCLHLMVTYGKTRESLAGADEVFILSQQFFKIAGDAVLENEKVRA